MHGSITHRVHKHYGRNCTDATSLRLVLTRGEKRLVFAFVHASAERASALSRRSPLIDGAAPRRLIFTDRLSLKLILIKLRLDSMP